MDLKKIFEIGEQFAPTQKIDSNRYGRAAVGLESDAQTVAGLEGYKETVRTAITQANVGVESEQQLRAAEFAAGISLSPSLALGQSAPDGISETVKPGALGIYDAAQVGAESFDGQDIASVVKYTVAGAIANAKLDDATEMLFPTVVIDPAQSGIKVETEVVKVYNEFKRSTTQSNADQFKKVSLVKAISDPAIINNNSNELTPVYSKGTNDSLFVSGLSNTVTLEGKPVITAPLAVGQTIPLLGLSQTAAMLSRRMADQTDALDPSVLLTNLYVNLDGTDIIDINLEPLAVSFTPTFDGHNKDIVLAFNSKIISFKTSAAEPLAITGANSPFLAKLPANYTVVLDVAVTGNGNVESGDIVVYGNKISVLEVRDATDKAVSLTAGDGKAIVTALAGMKIDGYAVRAMPTNSNVADLGLLGSVEVYGKNYIIPVRPALSIQRPQVNAYNKDNDYNRLVDRINISVIRSKIDAHQTITKFFNGARNIIATGGDLSGFTSVLPASAYVDTYIESDNIDLAATLDSRRSGQRNEDIGGAIKTRIADAVDRMISESNYGVAHDILNPGEKIVVNVVSNGRIARYLKGLEFGGNIIVKTASWYVAGMQDEVFVVLGTENPVKGSKVDILNFGFRGYAPTVFAEVQRGQNTAITTLHNSARFLNVVQTPIGAKFTVSGLDSAVKGKVALNTHTV